MHKAAECEQCEFKIECGRGNIEDFRSQARQKQSEYSDFWLVFEGDWGGQTYLTVPLSLLGDNAQPYVLLHMLDHIAWACNDDDGCSINLISPTMLGEANKQQVSEVMAVFRLEETLWLHSEFEAVASEVRQLLDLR